MFRKLHAESMERTLVHARDEAFHSLVGEEFQSSEALLERWGWVDGHGRRDGFGSNKTSPPR